MSKPPESHRGDIEDSGVIEGSHLNIRIDDKEHTVPAGISVAAALTLCGVSTFRRTVNGDARGLFCGMGVCYDCLVTIDNSPDQRACMRQVRAGMQISTGSDLQ